MFLGFRLRELRKKMGLSQSELGKILGVTKSSISGYEKGLRVPSMEVLLIMIKLFDVSADYMLGRELNVVCEDDATSLLLGSNDIEIIRELRSRPILYNKIGRNPTRFFNTIEKKKI